MRLEDLYTPRILALATALPQPGEAREEPDGEARRRTRACGSRIWTRVWLDGAGRVSHLMQHVEACALGQAAAAIVGRCVIGAGLEELRAIRRVLRAMLEEGAPPPSRPCWRALEALEPVRDFPPRHEAVLLPFDAAIAAVRAALEKRHGVKKGAEGG